MQSRARPSCRRMMPGPRNKGNANPKPQPHSRSYVICFNRLYSHLGQRPPLLAAAESECSTHSCNYSKPAYTLRKRLRGRCSRSSAFFAILGAHYGKNYPKPEEVTPMDLTVGVLGTGRMAQLHSTALRAIQEQGLVVNGENHDVSIALYGRDPAKVGAARGSMRCGQDEQ